MSTEKLNCVSLFSGGMGLDLGLEGAGFDVRFAADNMPAAVQTIRLNRPEIPVFDGDIAELSADRVYAASGLQPGEVDLVSGGPPCQTFSTAGKRRGLDDPEKGSLLFEYVRLIAEIRPRAFVMENVRGLLSASSSWRQLPYNNNGKIIDDLHGSAFRELRNDISQLGYSFKHALLNAADFGVPQKRQRVVIIGYRDGREVTFPPRTHGQGMGLFGEPWVPISEVLHDVDNSDSPCAQFSPRKLRYLRQVPQGGNWRNLPEDVQRESMGRAYHAKGGRSGYWRRLSMDAPSPTILTEPHNASTSLCHPTEDRPLSVRECARIQTFPDDWQFFGTTADQYRLIGNAVPPLLAEVIGRQIRSELDRARTLPLANVSD